MMGPKRLDANLPEFKKLGNTDVQFQLLNDDQKPLKKRDYVFIDEHGQCREGVTDDDGRTEVYQSVLPEQCSVHLL